MPWPKFVTIVEHEAVPPGWVLFVDSSQKIIGYIANGTYERVQDSADAGMQRAQDSNDTYQRAQQTVLKEKEIADVAKWAGLDAWRWAEAFLAHTEQHRHIARDPATMALWFAWAIKVGHDAGRKGTDISGLPWRGTTEPQDADKQR